MSKNYYLVLGVSSQATLADIKEAYRRLVKAYHPDRYGENHDPFLAIQEAYSILSDPIKRQTHDLEIQNQNRTGPGHGYGLRPRAGTRIEPLIPKANRPFHITIGVRIKYWY